MAGHAARRWILEVRLHRRVGEVFLARFWKKAAVVIWVDWMGAARPLDGHQHVMLPDGSLDSRQRPISPIHRHGREMDRMPAHHLHRLGVDLGRMIEADRKGAGRAELRPKAELGLRRVEIGIGRARVPGVRLARFVRAGRGHVVDVLESAPQPLRPV